MRRLIGLDFSPWTQKARWALDHHRVEYRFVPYVSMIGEPMLRWYLRKPLGKVSVPCLIDIAGSFADSWDIARRADEIGTGVPLIPTRFRHEIARWNEISNRTLAWGRVQLFERARDDTQMKQELLPPFVPRSLRRALVPLANSGLRYLESKYTDSPSTPMREGLDALREALEANGRRYILGEFTYADIAMAVVFQMVDPVRGPFDPLPPASRRCWSDPPLARDYPDLIAWRDLLFSEHR